jgi:thiosulfate/3-mercaptopyruvate sulfurtransferase
MTAPYRTLVSAAELLTLRSSAADLVIVDCGFDLADASAGERAYVEGHLPGARYAHLDRDLSGPKTGKNGRHPLPDRDLFAARVGTWDIGPGTQVVAYDAQGGPYAARAWWMLRWLGHEAVAVLDGGPAAWLAAGGGMETGIGPRRDEGSGGHRSYPSRSSDLPTVDAQGLQAALARHEVIVVDARAPERFRGDVEPLDPVAGHIPGALNRFFKDNLDASGRFKAPSALRAEFQRVGIPGAARGGTVVVHQCGSGVTACHNLLAMAHCGMDGAALYPGSWSEWCADPKRAVARG